MTGTAIHGARSQGFLVLLSAVLFASPCFGEIVSYRAIKLAEGGICADDSGFDFRATGISGNQRVAFSELVDPGGNETDHGILFTGSTSISFGDRLNGVLQGKQVGAISGHAGLWSGSDASLIDLNPPGATRSEALGLDANHQVGVVDGH